MDISIKRTREFAVSGFGQAGAAILTLFYLRFAVRNLSLDAYGLSAAWIGTHMLLKGLLLLPLLQLLVYRFHEQQTDERRELFSSAILRTLLYLNILLFGIACIGLALFKPTAARWFIGASLVGLLSLSEGAKSFAMNHLNLKERHTQFASALLGDAGLRLVLLRLLIPRLHGDPVTLLVAPIISSLAISCLIGRPLLRAFQIGPKAVSLAQLCWVHRGFLAPIAIISITSWVTGLSDRYFLLHWAGKSETGRYAAVYGIFSTPFSLLAETLVLVIRPRLTMLTSKGSSSDILRAKHREFLSLWVIASCTLAAGLWTFRGVIGHYMLRPEHELCFPYLPYLLAGQIAFCLGRLVEVEFYILRLMNRVLIKQIVGFSVALIFMWFLIPSLGIKGAMMACLGYYSVECLSGFILLKSAPGWAPENQSLRN